MFIFNVCKSFLSHRQVNPTEVVKGEEFEVKISFTNPLKEKMTGGHFHIEGPGIVKSLIIDCK